MQNSLFDKEQYNKPHEGIGKTCNTCSHRQRWDFGTMVFQYCGVRKSNRTSNGLLKIKCKMEACPLYENKPKQLKDAN